MNNTKESHAQKKDIRIEILKVSNEILINHGIGALSLRKIAANMNCSPTYIYHFFKSKNEILYTLHQGAFKLFCSYINKSRSIREPLSKLKAIGKYYLLFAKENPEYYNIVFQNKQPMLYLQTEGKHWEEGKKIVNFLNENVLKCQKMGYFSNQDSERLSVIVWGLTHGLTSNCAGRHLKINHEPHQDIESYKLKIYTELLDNIA